MGLLVPSSKPRRFHLELTQRDERRMRLQEIKESSDMRKRSRSEEEHRSELTDGISHSNFEYLRGRFQTSRQRKTFGRGLAVGNGLLVVVIVGLIALAWLLLNF